MTEAAAIRSAWADGIRPDPLLTVSEWADAHRRLPKKSSAEPGPWRTARTPYLREIMDCFSARSEVEEVVFMKAAQIGGSEAILNALGYVIDHSPGPTILVQPTVELAKRFSRQRLDPLVTATPRLVDKVARARARETSNTMLSKEFPGGQLIITGANSAVGLRSMPAQYALLDEIDGYPIDVNEEGSPLELVEVRQRTFIRRKRIKVSTPTIAGRSAIEDAYNGTDRRRYYVPCPHCGEFQPLEFSRLIWSRLSLAPGDAVYECRACLAAIHEHHKTAMLEAGEWRPENPDADPRVRGYHINALYAPIGWLSWGEIARQFLKVQKNPEKLRVFINTVLGEVWTARGEAPEWEALHRRREVYDIGTVPIGPLFLTAGVDVQKDRLVVEVVGWGRGKESWSVDYFDLPGDTADLDRGPWPALAAALERDYPQAGGHAMTIRMLAVDSGFNTQTVYAWGRTWPMNRVMAIKGFEGGSGVLVGSPTPVEVTVRGRKLKRGYRMWPVYGAIAKTELYGWLKLEAPLELEEFPAGYCHFPQYGETYFKELTAEQLVLHHTKKGFTRVEWEMIPGRQNHALDARVYARAAAAIVGLDRFTEKDWSTLERALGLEYRPPAPPAAAPAARSSPAPAPAAASSSPAPPAPPKGRPRWLPLPRRGGWLRDRNR